VNPLAGPGLLATGQSPRHGPGAPEVPASLGRAWANLEEVLRARGPLVVALSGGVDSALLAVAARQVLGRDAVLAATAVSPSLAFEELLAAARLAARHDLAWCQVATFELEDPRYQENQADRCYRCKTALLRGLAPLARARGATVALGVTRDDLGDYRPGQQAAAERGARFPLLEAGLHKAEVRALARALDLEVWDKPAAPCLASRLPYGTPVTLGRLRAVEDAERGLRHLGFREVRVRHHGTLARLELPEADLPRALAERAAVVAAVQAAGFRDVTLDLQGLRSGNLNAALRPEGRGGR
jgi:uncharacterized protein